MKQKMIPKRPIPGHPKVPCFLEVFCYIPTNQNHSVGCLGRKTKHFQNHTILANLAIAGTPKDGAYTIFFPRQLDFLERRYKNSVKPLKVHPLKVFDEGLPLKKASH